MQQQQLLLHATASWHCSVKSEFLRLVITGEKLIPNPSWQMKILQT